LITNVNVLASHFNAKSNRKPLPVAKRVGLDLLLLMLDIPEIASLFTLEKVLLLWSYL